MKLYYDYLTVNNNKYHLFATDKGLYYVSGQNEDITKNDIYKNEIILSKEIMKPYTEELSAYLSKKLKTFSIQLHFSGTSFQIEVYRALLTIPYGQLTTYTEIAKLINRPKSVRAVANAIGSNKISIVVPCHRVIRKDMSLGGYAFGLKMKRDLLDIEDIKY